MAASSRRNSLSSLPSVAIWNPFRQSRATRRFSGTPGVGQLAGLDHALFVKGALIEGEAHESPLGIGNFLADADFDLIAGLQFVGVVGDGGLVRLGAFPGEQDETLDG